MGVSSYRSPTYKFGMVALAALALVIPLFMVFLIVYDRQSQSLVAQRSITEGWGGPQTIDGPVLAIPYWQDAAHDENQNGHTVTIHKRVLRRLIVAPDISRIETVLRPETRRRSIYSTVVYQADNRGTARFLLPTNLAALDITPDLLMLDRAELRFGVSDANALAGPRPLVSLAGRALTLETGEGTNMRGAGFHAPVDAHGLASGVLTVDYAYVLRGSSSLALAPRAGDTTWSMRSPWADPGFQGDFLPTRRNAGKDGFSATWRVGNLALGRPLAEAEGEHPAPDQGNQTPSVASVASVASVDLVTPVDLYGQINRAVKYGFLFIGFTFAAFLMFDVIGGAAVAAAEYLLVGAALILFFVMLLAFAEVIGFLAAYMVAAGAIIGLVTAYSVSVLQSGVRAAAMAAVLGALYAVLYVLLNLEAYALLVGSLLLFGALALVMYLTRKIDWSGEKALQAA
ncbi:MAG: cell envelope integrity protein CreD [Sphingomonas sp.]|jgi:inner membrane protein